MATKNQMAKWESTIAKLSLAELVELEDNFKKRYATSGSENHLNCAKIINSYMVKKMVA